MTTTAAEAPLSRLTRFEAYRKDRLGDFYVDEDEKSGLFCVFGSETGFCYGTHADKDAANRDCNNLTDGKASVR